MAGWFPGGILEAIAISDAARALYHGAMVFDANAHPPWGDTPLPTEAELELARGSGVTALKWTLGSIDHDFETTIRDIALVQRLIEAHPDVYLPVRTACGSCSSPTTRPRRSAPECSPSRTRGSPTWDAGRSRS